MHSLLTATIMSLLLLIMLPVISYAEALPTGVDFQLDTVHREATNGDNWCITWGADGHQYTAMCDGKGWDPQNKKYRSRTYRIKGDVDNFSVDMLKNFPLTAEGTPWYGYGICTVNGTLYNFMSQTPENSWSGPFLGR